MKLLDYINRGNSNRKSVPIRMAKLLQVALFLIVVFPANIFADCCDPTVASFKKDDVWPHIKLAGKIKLCGNGNKLIGFYCGVGKCNIFGCSCNGGCIKGDAIENFRQLNPCVRHLKLEHVTS